MPQTTGIMGNVTEVLSDFKHINVKTDFSDEQ